MNTSHYAAKFTPLLTAVLTALLKAAPFLEPEYAEVAAAAVAWLLIHWPA